MVKFRSEIMRLPNFFIVGAAKAGTTSLWRYLLQHPDIFMPPDIMYKEPAYFSDIKGFRSLSEYTKLFSSAKTEKMIGEASTAYLTSPESPVRIKELIPDVKIIIMLRNPIDRAYSLYNWMACNGYEPAGSFEEALEIEKHKRFGNETFKHSNPEYYYNYLYYYSGLYSEQIKGYLNCFNKEQFCIIIFEKFKDNAKKEVNTVFKFLGVDDSFAPEFKIHNSGTTPYSASLQFFIRQELYKYLRPPHNLPHPVQNNIIAKLMKLNTRSQKLKPMSESVRDILRDKYFNDVQRTGELIGHNLSRWWPEFRKKFPLNSLTYKRTTGGIEKIVSSPNNYSKHKIESLKSLLDQPISLQDLMGNKRLKSGAKFSNNSSVIEKNSKSISPTLILKSNTQDKSYKIIQLCVQDYGGAGKAAYRLHQGLRQIGVDSTMLVMNKRSGDPSVKVLPSEYSGSLTNSKNIPSYVSPLWTQQLLRWQNELAKYPNRPVGFEMFTDALSDIRLEQIQDIKNADIINLHWVAGVFDYPTSPLAFKDKKVFWTLHDMNPFTGGCHYSGDCEKYTESCGACPQLGSTAEDDLSRQTWEIKNRAFQNLDLNIVTPSNWLASCAANSSLMSRFPVTVIPNGFPFDTFKPYPKNEIRRSLNIPENANVILFGADSIVNARKGFVYLLEALKRVPNNKDNETVVLTFGNFPEGLQIHTEHAICNLGSIIDENKLALAYSAADVFVIPSLEDNLPNTVVEAMACGVPVVGFNIGGIPDMIVHKKNGFLAKPKDINSLLEGIEWGISSSNEEQSISALCRETAEIKYDLAVQASAYKKLYEAEIIKNKAGKRKYLVSAIVSTYNAERFTRGRIEDLENQSIADKLEIVIVNSGSQQDEEKIIREFQEQYSNIKYIKTNHRETVYAAWNRGIKAASGKYITNANTDDRLRQDALEVMVNTLEAHPEIALVYADVIITDTENETFERCTPVGLYNWLDFNRDDLLNRGCFVGPQPMWRREVHIEYGYFDASFVTSGDYEFWLRISQTNTFLHIPIRLGLYLRSPGSIEHSNREKQWKENHKILKMYRQARSCGKIIRRIQVGASPDPTESRSENMKSPEAIYRKIQTEMGNKKPEEVIGELEMLASSYPQFALAHNDLGVLHYYTGNKETAQQFYEKAVHLDPENMVFQKNLADFYYVELGRVEDALQIYLKTLETNPADIETLLITGHICVSLHRFKDARVFYHRVLEQEPANAVAHQNLEKLNQMNPAPSEQMTPEEMYAKILPLLNNGDPHKAIASLEKLLVQFPDFATAHNDMGVLYYHTDDPQKAQDHYERAVELMPDNINFQKNLADFYCIERGRIEDALKIYVRILQLDPQDVETLMATGQICKALERFDDARDFFNRVLQIEPGHAEAREQIKEMQSQMSETALNSESAEDAYRRLQEKLNRLIPQEAIEELEKLIEFYPNFAVGHNDLGALHYNTGNKEKALHHYEQAARLQPENMTLQKHLADFLFVESGKMEEALQIYVNILTKHPDDLETLLIAGHICVALKRFEEAKEFYHRVLAIEPDHEDAGKNLQALINRQNGQSSAKADSSNDETVWSAKAEEIDPDNEKSENEDAQHQPTVSIIISLDGIQNRIKQCVESLTTHTQDAFEILLIDNGATKGTLKWAQNLEKDKPHFRIINCDRTDGRAQCLNQAVQAAAGEYVVWVHNDVIVAEGWFKGMLRCFQRGSEIGVVGPMSNAASGIQTVDLAVDRDPKRLDSDADAFYTQNQYRRIPTTPLASFCLMFRRALFDRIGDFDVQLISEQAVVTDFCKRSAAWGYQNLVAGDVLVYHADRHKGNHDHSDAGSKRAEDKKRLNKNWAKITGDQRFSKNIQMMALLKTVDVLQQKGFTDQAVETMLNAIGAVPAEKMLYLALAEICLSLKRYQDAIEALGEMPSESKTDADSEANEDLEDAGSDSVLPVGFENPALKRLEILGFAEEGLENFSAAESYAERMLSIEPRSARALNLIGILAFRQNDLKAAEQFFEQAIASDPSGGEPYSNLATVKLASGEEEEALRLLEKGFILSPTDLDIATNYHAVVAARGEYKRAEGVAREAAAIYPNNQKISYMLVDVLLQQGKHADAMDRIEAAVVRFGIEDGILEAALQVRKKLGCMTIGSSQEKPAVSCCMIIKDEEKYLARCLASVKPIADEMIVVDTGSADRSKEIATAFGAQVYDLEWQKDFAKARNFSLEKASGDWVFIIDGDEVISPLDYSAFNRIVKNRPKAPVAYSIVTRNYSALANIVGWVPNDGKYVNEEAAAGWIPSIKTRLFYGKHQIWFEGAVHELVDPVVKRKGFETKQCSIPVHHYGRLDKERLKRKGEVYFEIGKKKMEETGDDIAAVREMAIQATTLEENEMAVELWHKLISLDPPDLMVADAYINMATLYNRLSNFEQALMVAKKGVAKAPHIKESLYNYAMAELHVGNAQATINVLEDLVKRVPDYPPSQFILSAAYFCIGEKEEGFKIIQELQGSDLGPNLVYPIFELAETLLKAQQNEYAFLLLGTAIEYDIANKQILELFNKCIQMRETTKNFPEPPVPLPPDRELVNFENLPQ
jgi:tetratricopeptide (TPR) repeat protein